MITSFIEQNPERPVYTTFDAGASADAQQLLPGVRRVPVGLLYELRRDTVIPEFDYSRLSVRLPGHAIDSRTRACLEHYRYFVMQRARALLEAGRRAEAEEVVRAYMALPVSRFAPMPDGN
jgi:hypothetical protein